MSVLASGRVIEERGDMFTFTGPCLLGTVAPRVRRARASRKHYTRTQAPAGVDRLVALAATVGREPYRSRDSMIRDAPVGLQPVRNAYADVPLPLPFATKFSRRGGPASTEAEEVIAKCTRHPNRERSARVLRSRQTFTSGRRTGPLVAR